MDDDGRHGMQPLGRDSKRGHMAKQTASACFLSQYQTHDLTNIQVDFDTFAVADYNIISDISVDFSLRSKFISTGIPPRDHAFVTFTDRTRGSSLLHESKLLLIDRSLSIGDVVKRAAGDAMSGTIIRTNAECNLLPSFSRVYSNASCDNPLTGATVLENDFLFNGSQSRNQSQLLRGIPAEELKSVEEWQAGTFIIYQGWLGRVVEAWEDITIGLSNGSAVVVEEPEDLQILSRSESGPGLPIEVFAPGLLVQTKKGNLRRGNWIYGAYNPSIAPRGMILEASVHGVDVTWLSRNFSSPGASVMPMPPLHLESEILESGEAITYHRGKMPPATSTHGYSLGFVSGSDLSTGDTVRFKDLTGATVKYDGSRTTVTGHSHGKLIRIPRSVSEGYDINVFEVVETRTTVIVLWQDMTRSQEWSGALMPYLNVDDYDVWPGEVVIPSDSTALTAKPTPGDWKHPNSPPNDTHAHGPAPTQARSISANDGDVLRPRKVGVVQSVDSNERIAQVRWSLNSTLELAGSEKNTLLPGGLMGELGGNSELVSVYELMAKPGLTTRVGDFVLVYKDETTIVTGESPGPISGIEPSVHGTAPNSAQPIAARNSAVERLLSFLSAPDRDRLVGLGATTPASTMLENINAVRTNLTVSQRGVLDQVLSELPPDWWRNALTSLDGQQNSQGHRHSESDSGHHAIDWFGEVVGLGLDGLVTVRLGALEEARDIRVPIHRIRVIYSGDDDSDLDSAIMDESEDGWSDDYISLTGSQDVLEETVEYEGGERIDADGDENLWSTDEEDADVASDVSMTDAEGNEPLYEEMFTASAQQAHDEPVENICSDQRHKAHETTDSLHEPDRFVILESEPSQNHPYINSTSDLSTKQMRRIQKEHKILRSSMPGDIYVRTWESRLDLLRVLILGPRNTPYELAPFLIDFRFGPTFPAEPPEAFFHSWTNGVGRVNPNLYEDGKICLSLLGTWPATEKNARWSEGQSSMLQVLVSIMGLVLVKEPYYNEAGFDILIGSEESRLNAAQYSERAYVLARGFLKHALYLPSNGFEDVIRWLYHPDVVEGRHLLKDVINEAKETIRRSENKTTNTEVTGILDVEEKPRRVSAGALRLLRTNIQALENMIFA
ncbi:MAG: hypothetical protein M1812_006292 [Candelaria pacifica]|nr:MAG: hypothetical protein M1812_006292 [Candelaria pacifica]